MISMVATRFARQHQENFVADLTEEERKTILGDKYRPPDPNAPKAPLSWLERIWAAIRGKSGKA